MLAADAVIHGSHRRHPRALIGFAVEILFTEVIFASNQSWPDVVPFALAIADIFGIYAGAARRSS